MRPCEGRPNHFQVERLSNFLDGHISTLSVPWQCSLYTPKRLETGSEGGISRASRTRRPWGLVTKGVQPACPYNDEDETTEEDGVYCQSFLILELLDRWRLNHMRRVQRGHVERDVCSEGKGPDEDEI